MLLGELLLLQVDQLPEGHAEDGVGLDGRERVALLGAPLRLEDGEPGFAQRLPQQGRRALDQHQPLLGLGLGVGGADGADHLVDVGVGQQQPFHRVFPLPGLGQQVLRAAADHDHPVAEEFLHQSLEGEHPGLAVHQGQEDDRDGVLERRELVELVEHDLGVDVPLLVAGLELQHDADRLLQVALVADRGDAADPLLVDQLRDPLHDPVARLLVGDLADHDAVPVADLLDAGPCADRDRAPAGMVGLADAGPAADDAAGGEVRSGDFLEQLVDRDFGVVDEFQQGVADLAQVVRRDRGGHAHGDAVGPVDQEVGKLRGQHRGLGPPLVVGGDELHRVQPQILEHQRRDRRHAGFGVPHGRRRQSGDRAEVALLVDQHVAEVPLLGHADQGGVDHALAVGMIVAAGIAGDLGTLHPACPRREVQVVHRHQDPPLRGLQAVADVGQGPADDHAHGVDQVAVFKLLFDGHVHQPPGRHHPIATTIFGRESVLGRFTRQARVRRQIRR